MRYSNLHTHTTYSDGQHSIEENILSAINKNMVSLGFSDHSCTDFDLRYCMQPEKVAEYIAEVRRMQKKYEEVGADSQLICIDGAPHEGSFWSGAVHEQIMAFFDKHLK